MGKNMDGKAKFLRALWNCNPLQQSLVIFEKFGRQKGIGSSSYGDL